MLSLILNRVQCGQWERLHEMVDGMVASIDATWFLSSSGQDAYVYSLTPLVAGDGSILPTSILLAPVQS